MKRLTGDSPDGVRSVLVVSDELVVVDVIKEVCQCGSAAIEVAGGNCDALAMIESRNFDVIYIDLNKTKADGLALYKYIGVYRPHLLASIVFITGGGEDPVTYDYLKKYRCRTLRKPFALKELLKTLPWTVEDKNKLPL